MNPETATSVTDIALSVGTLVLGLTVGPRKSYRTWTALFFTLALAAGLGAIYHGVERFHTRDFWTLVSCTSAASAFLFFAACACTARPQWTWLHWLWPLWGLAGVLLGGMLAPMPFWYLSVVSGVMILLSIMIIRKSPYPEARRWIHFGIATTILALVAQKTTHYDGLLSHNALFHELQLLGNFFFWMGARQT